MDINYVINYLKNSNKYLESSLIEGFINEKTIKYIPIYALEYLGMNKEAQEIIMNLSENNLKIISIIISYANRVGEDWLPLCSQYYHLLNNNNFKSLITDIESRGLDESLIENLLFVCKNGNNYFEIKSIDDLARIDTIREEKNNQNGNTYNPNILLLNKYGISYDSAYVLYKKYGKDGSKLPDSKEKEFLLDIKNIIEGKGTNKTVCQDKSFIVNIDSILRNYFTKIYNDSLYKITDNKKIGEVDGVPIYDAGVDFHMCIYSYGLATDYPIPENYKTDWNRPSISSDYLCNSIISSCSMKTRVKHCVYGFDNIGRNELALLGSNDLGTGGIYRNINITNPFYQEKLIAEVEFRTPDELINNTRFTNNEVYRSRRRVVDGKLERINPNYIVYFKNNEDFREDPIWIESINAAKNFNVPIVIVDCEKCLLNNIQKIEEKMKLFESRSDDSEILSSILEMIYTVNSGFQNISPQLLERYFNKDKLLSYVERIVVHIDEISTSSPKTSLECTNIVLNTLNGEYEKVLKSPYWVEHARQQGNIVDKPNDVIAFFERKRNELERRCNYQNVAQQRSNTTNN